MAAPPFPFLPLPGSFGIPTPNGIPLLPPNMPPHLALLGLDPRIGQAGELDLSKPKSSDNSDSDCASDPTESLKRTHSSMDNNLDICDKKPRLNETNNNNHHADRCIEQPLPPSSMIANMGCLPSIEERVRLMHQHVLNSTSQLTTSLRLPPTSIPLPPPLMKSTSLLSNHSSTYLSVSPPMSITPGIDMDKIKEEVTRTAMKQIAELRCHPKLLSSEDLKLVLLLLLYLL